MTESNVPKPGPATPAHERGAAEVEDAMRQVRALPDTQQLSADDASDDSSESASRAAGEVDLDAHIETLSAAHDTLRRQLSSIDR